MKLEHMSTIATGKVDLARIRERMGIGGANPLDARPGKAGEAVGHQAKRSVFEAIEAGALLPKNAQGLAASRIAAGADPTSIFAALVVPDVPEAVEEEGGTHQGVAPDPGLVEEEHGLPELTGGPTPGTAPVVEEMVEEEIGPVELPVTETQTPPDFGTDPAEAALALLRGSEDDG